jgi:hypothetical protein
MTSDVAVSHLPELFLVPVDDNVTTNYPLQSPKTHAHPVVSKWPRNQTPHAYKAYCVVVTLHRMLVVGNTLEVSRCRTRRRLCAKYRLRRPPAADDGWA